MSKAQMGLGRLGDPSIMIRRKFRWTLEILDPYAMATVVQPQFVKVNARPNLQMEETEINYLNNKMWIPGKSNWEELNVTYFSMGNNDKDMQDLYTFLAWQSGDLSDPTIAPKKSAFILKLYDGCGNTIEEWKLSDSFVTKINFGELDYTSSEEVTLEMSIRYSQIEYKNHCPGSGMEPMWEGIMATRNEYEWKRPSEWIIKTPIMECVSPGERILDQFLRRTTSR